MNQAEQSNAVIKINQSSPIKLEQTQQHIQNQQQNTYCFPVNRWHLGSTIILNFFYFLMLIILPIPSANIGGKLFLGSLTLISFIIYLAFAYKFSTMLFIIRIKPLDQYEKVYNRYVKAQCILNFIYAPTRNNIDEEMKKFQQEYQQIIIEDKSQQLQKLDSKYCLACVKYNKRYYYSTNIFKAHIYNEFNTFIQKCKASYDKFTRKLLTSHQKIELQILDFSPQFGYYIDQDNHYRLIFFITYCLGFGAYFEYYMRNKVFRCQIDIVKEICPKSK